MVIESIVAEPLGRASAAGTRIALASPFVCSEGAELHLGDHWAAIMDSELLDRVLPSAPPTTHCAL